MPSFRVILAGAALAVALGHGAGPSLRAQAPPVSIDVSTVGPQPGALVPDFTLPDQDGRPRSLASLAGRNGTMLVFSRSADW